MLVKVMVGVEMGVEEGVVVWVGVGVCCSLRAAMPNSEPMTTLMELKLYPLLNY